MGRIFLYLFGIFIFCATCSWGQTTQWTASTDYDGSHNDMVTDQFGNTYTIGDFNDSIDVDPGPNRVVFYTNSSSFTDIYIKKLDSQGNLVWAKSIGGFGYDNASSIALDQSGNLYVTGKFDDEVDFDPGPGVFLLSDNVWQQDAIFLLKLNNAGDFIWANAIGGVSLNGVTYPSGKDIAIDSAGYVYLTGVYAGTLDFDPGPGVYIDSTSNGAFVEKFDSSGNFIWVKQIDNINSSPYTRTPVVTCDNAGNIYMAGNYFGVTDLDPGAGTYNVTSQGISIDGDIFFIKLTDNGDFVWGNSVSNSLMLEFSDFILSKDERHLYMTGTFDGIVDFDPGLGVSELTSDSITDDVFILKMDTANNFEWARRYGNREDDRAAGITEDEYGNVYITSRFDRKGYVHKVNAEGYTIWNRLIDLPNPPNRFDPIAISHIGKNEMYIAGLDGYYFQGGNSFVTHWDLTGQPSLEVMYASACKNYALNGQIYTNSGTYTQVLPNVEGGDSTIILYLTITAPILNTMQLGASGRDGGGDVLVDNMGNQYITGSFTGIVDFDPTTGVFNLSSGANTHGFVQKLSPQGQLLWARAIQGNGRISGKELQLDASGNLYILGGFNTSIQTGAGSVSSLGGNDIFLQKLDPSGNIVWTKTLRGTSNDIGNGIVIDNAGYIYTTGYFHNTVDFDPNVGTTNLTATGGTDLFVQKLDLAGNLIWVKTVGAASSASGNTLTLDHLGNLIVIGNFENTVDFDPNAGTFNLSAQGQDMCILKLDNAGNFIWAKGFGSFAYTEGYGVATDNVGNVYCTGLFVDQVDFDPGPSSFNLFSFGNESIYVLKLDNNGNFVWAKAMNDRGSGTTFSAGHDLVLDPLGNIYLAGYFSYGTIDFDPGPNFFELTSIGEDAFIQRLDNNGNFDWAKSLTGIGDASASEITITSDYMLHVIGSFEDSVDFDPGANVYNLVSNGNRDIFVQKLDSAGNFPSSGSTDTIRATTCGTYTLNGQVYSSTGIYTQNLTNVAGCDSILILDLTKNITTGVDVQTACNSYVWIDGNTYTSSNNTATYTITTAGGCDSIVTLDLVIAAPSTSTQSTVIDFETAGVGYTPSTTAGTGFTDVFNRTDVDLGINTTEDGFYWAVEDLAVVNPSIDLTQIDITGSTSFNFALDLLAHHFDDWDGTDELIITYSVDGGTYQNLMAVQNTHITNSNETAALDTDFDGVGECSMVLPALTLGTNSCTATSQDFQTFISSNIPLVGNSTLDIKLQFNGLTATDEGIYLDNITITEAVGSGLNTDVQTACNSYTWIDGNTYTSSNNTATFTLTNAAGCDSIVTLDLTINNSSTSTDVQTACNSYTWIDGNTYTSSNNTATFTLINAAGCDSIVTLDLTINNSSTSTDLQTACNGYTWIDGNTYTSSNNTATFTLTNAAGCDSIVTLDLTINNSSTSTDVQTACNSYTWIDGNTYTNSNNTAIFTLTNVSGCDSVVTLDLTINNSASTDIQTACNSYTWIDGNTYTSSNNTAIFTLTNAAGCDSIVTLDLTINNSSASTDVQTACNSYTWIDGNTYTSSNNTATFTLTNVAGCDSIVTLDLTINNSSASTDVQTACNSYTWIDGNTYTSSNNTAIFTLTNAAGCDSVVTLDLTINNSSTSTDVQTACNSYTWIDGNTYTSSNNTAIFTLTNVSGCDSVVTLDLTINNNASTDVQTACSSYTWIDGNTYTSSNNTATFTLTNVSGCDSVVTLDLTINNNASTDIQTACNSYTWIDGNTYTSSNNTATFTLTNAAGCDSIVTLDLTINNSSTSTDVQTACNSYTWVDGNTYTSSNNTATFTLTNAAGCDSIVTLDLTINNSSASTDVQTACNSYTWIDGNTYTSTNNTATFTLTNTAGCDSVITLDLIVNTIDTSVSQGLSQNGWVLTSNEIGATYQWIDCTNGNVLITGATASSYIPSNNGSYAVIITKNGCVDTSNCINVTISDVVNIETELSVQVYPNPTDGRVLIVAEELLTDASIRILAMNGQLLREERLSTKEHQLDINLFPSAVYIVEIQSKEGVYQTKLIKR